MKKIALVALCMGSFVAVQAQSKKQVVAQNDSLKTEIKVLKETIQKQTKVDLQNEKAQFSYAIGVSFATNLKSQGIDSLDLDALLVAMKDIEGGQPKMSASEAGQLIQTYMESQQMKQFSSVKEEGEKFLAENAKKPGVKVLPSGMQYQIITEGKGPKPSPTDKVTTHYHGTLVNGQVFDSSVERGQPASFPVNGVIQGWQEALVLMPVGSKWRLFIPYTSAYGERGAGGSIKPYSALIFDVELISIDK